MYVFGQWEEAEIIRENPHIHGENMQTPHRQAPARIRTWNPPRHQVTVLATTATFNVVVLKINFSSGNYVLEMCILKTEVSVSTFLIYIFFFISLY